MKKSKHLIRNIILIVIALAIVAGFVLFRLNGSSKMSGYSTRIAQTRDVTTYYTFSGNLTGGDTSITTARVSGTLSQLLHQEGDIVAKDEPVLQTASGTKIKASDKGTITDIYVDVGENYTAGQQLFRVIDFTLPSITIRVDEYDISAITRGTEATVKVQATGDILKGVVTHVAQEATISGDVAYYTAKVEVPYTESLHIGMTCEIQVPRQSSLNATTLPIDTIQYAEDGTPFVYMQNGNGDIIRQNVTVGINNGTIVEIIYGVRSGDTVLKPTSTMAQMLAMRGMTR